MHFSEGEVVLDSSLCIHNLKSGVMLSAVEASLWSPPSKGELSLREGGVEVSLCDHYLKEEVSLRAGGVLSDPHCFFRHPY